MKKDELISVLKNPESLKIPPHTIYGREYDKWMPLLSLAKIFSTDKNNYFEEVISYANDCINQQKENEANTPENICKSIVSEFLSSSEAKSVIVDDKNHSYFTCTQIQEIIIELDQHNYYRNKASVTKILKRIGISVDRRRIDKKGAVSLYKIPNMLFNGNHKVKEE